MLPSLAARLSGEMSLTKMWLARRRPYSAYRVNDSNKEHVSTESSQDSGTTPNALLTAAAPAGINRLIKED